jgi:phosphate acetyltransferase
LVKKSTQRSKVLLLEGNDDRIIIAASLLAMDVDISDWKQKKQIENKVAELDRLSLIFRKCVINPIESEKYDDYVNTYYELRKKQKMLA